MNKWVKKSIELANSEGYLDQLYEVYPVKAEIRGGISEREVKEALEARDNFTLVKKALRFPKFPINDSFVGFLRYGEHFVELNPKTVDRIAGIIRSMGFDEVLKAVSEPKVPSKQIGAMFKRWLPAVLQPMPTEHDFKKYRQIAFLHLGGSALKRFANEELNCDLDKAPDLIAKKGNVYVIAEAKFITAYGGGQSNQFRDALKLLHGKGGKATRIAILDGVLWIRDSGWMYHEIIQEEKPALSALLLKEFLRSL